MIGDHYDEEELAAFREYKGIPKEPNREGERSRWQRFLHWLIPRWAIAEQAALAIARQEIAKADILEEHAKQEAMKTIEMAAQMEQRKLEEADFEVVEDRKDIEDIEESLLPEWESLQEKMRLLGLKTGARFETKPLGRTAKGAGTSYRYSVGTATGVTGESGQAASEGEGG